MVAFEPAPGLVRRVAGRVSRDNRITLYRAAYEDLPRLFPPAGGEPARLEELGPFDVSLLGLGSISHVRTNENRARTLRMFGDVTRGPVIVSFLVRPEAEQEPRLRRFTGQARTRRGRDGTDRFALDAGFFHPFDEREIRDLAARAGLDVLQYDADVRKVYPHAVLKRGSVEDRSPRQKM